MSSKIQLKNVDDIFSKYLSEEEIQATDKEADEEMLVLKILQEDISKTNLSSKKLRF
jgi:hypothetical protein